jgi:hypothetical protein
MISHKTYLSTLSLVFSSSTKCPPRHDITRHYERCQKLSNLYRHTPFMHLHVRPYCIRVHWMLFQRLLTSDGVARVNKLARILRFLACENRARR